jgi:hypothetical protein
VPKNMDASFNNIKNIEGKIASNLQFSIVNLQFSWG